MKSVQTTIKENSYAKNTYKEQQSSKSGYNNNNNRQDEKQSFNFIEQSKLRVIQDNLVSINGLTTDFNDPNLLCDDDHFGKYGEVQKVIVTSQGKHRNAFIQVYITYESPQDAAFTIRAMDGIKIQGREISATFGTTKYCTFFLKQHQCRNQKCIYLHQYDTKNQLTDGVKNNLDFLDEKADKIINKNLKLYVERELKQKQEKHESQFPSIAETLQYLIDEGFIKKDIIDKLRKQVIQQKANKGKKSKQKTQINFKGQPESEQEIEKVSKSTNISPKKVQLPSNTKLQLTPKISKTQSPNKVKLQSEISQSQSYSSSDEVMQQQVDIQQKQLQFEVKNKKCNSLSTAPSPTKYQKLIEQQNIDRTIQKRIIKQIMKNKLVLKSRMDFVPHISYSKDQNNKIKDYVRRHLLNQI